MPLERFMAAWPALPQPWHRYSLVLGLIFAVECGLMFALPLLLPDGAPRILEAAADAFILTIVVSPVLWWTVVRPLQQASRLRDFFLADLFATIEDERKRIAHELHDGVGQSLTLLVSGLRSVNVETPPLELEQRGMDLRQLAQRALTDIRQLARGLRPSLLDDMGLAAAIDRVAEELEEHHGLTAAVDTQSMAGQRLPERVETAIFRIFQEATANIIQHSGASLACIRLVRGPHHVVLRVADNGCGFDPARVALTAGHDGHLGLIGMQERAALLGGTVAIDSTAGQGTTLIVTIPV
jgi:signal transduction histidine kinase